MKKAIYWLGYAILLIGGMAAAFTRLVPTESTATFLLGLMLLYNGVLILLDKNPVYQGKPRPYMLIYGIADLALGLMWLPVSVHPRANEGWLQLVTGAPVLLILLFAHIHTKKKGNV